MDFMALFEPVFQALNETETRYVICGGIAVVLHGYMRVTVDADLAIDLSPTEVSKSIKALKDLGFISSVPVDPVQLGNAAIRKKWIEEKHMRVFRLTDNNIPPRTVDLFVNLPMDFEDLWKRSEEKKLKNTTVRVAAIKDLIAMKQIAARYKDLDDIEKLRSIQEIEEKHKANG